ncbi:MAG: hypothetical protein CME62_12955 [Halobacteriovoraceae bacterium]|nr:hypothetical protein [Halobacteriovoraceae bacterium]|tara:strand:- start:363 stop:662 length:300 start_codon:yes stop_codon:yes gene_type:complete
MKNSVVLSLLLLASFSASAGDLKSFTLETGEKISVKKEIKTIFTGINSQIEMIELKDGSIIYDTEIRSLNFEDRVQNSGTFQNGGSLFLSATGDGSGGG